VNLGEVIGRLDPLKRVFGVRLEDFYNRMLKEGWTLGATQLLSVYHACVRLSHASQVTLLRAYWEASRPDVVVSLVPHFNRSLAESIRKWRPSTPFVTAMTDLADCPPHSWIEREQPYLICGSERAEQQAFALGLAESQVWRASGMILHPRFYDVPSLDRRVERRLLGLDPEMPMGLVLFGGEGSRAMPEIAERLAAPRLGVQLILICGHNAALAAKLRGFALGMPAFVEKFTTKVPYYMHLSDFFIGKPGPGSLSEAVAAGLPVITEHNAWTMPQERYNTEWILENGLGMVVGSFSRIGEAVAELLRPGVYAHSKRNAAAQNNRAVFEIPGMLEEVMTNSATANAMRVCEA
jgi:1,2-diacylglycerol 3-beta-galactosyltransferase